MKEEYFYCIRYKKSTENNYFEKQIVVIKLLLL